MDPHDVLKSRQCMLSTIFSKLQNGIHLQLMKQSIWLLLNALEEGLFKLASTKEDYLDPSTLESRLTSLIKARKSNNYNQILQNASSSSIETTMPTEVSTETETTMEKEKVVENGDQWETEIAEYLNSLSL